MRRTRSDRMAGLGELQLQVLDRLSQLGEATVHQIRGTFPEGDCPAYTTLLTVLRALEKKGLCTHRTNDRTHVFRLTGDVSQVRTHIISDLLERAFGGSPSALVTALLDVDSITDQELERVRKIIEDGLGRRGDGL